MRVRKDLLVHDAAGRPCVTVEEAARRKGMTTWGMRKRVNARTIEFIVMAGHAYIPIDALEKFEPRRRKKR